MPVRGIDHVQLAMPAGQEAAARAFYVGALGLREVPKPPVLAARGGCWFEGAAIKLHLGVEADFRPARKAHPGLRVSDLDDLAKRLAGAGYEPKWDTDLPHIRRFHVSDPVGNRLEIIQDANQAGHA